MNHASNQMSASSLLCPRTIHCCFQIELNLLPFFLSIPCFLTCTNISVNSDLVALPFFFEGPVAVSNEIIAVIQAVRSSVECSLTCTSFSSTDYFVLSALLDQVDEQALQTSTSANFSLKYAICLFNSDCHSSADAGVGVLIFL